MKYTAKSNEWNFNENVETENEDGTKKQDIFVHSWTVGKEYEVNIDKNNNTIQFESDITTSQVIPALCCGKDLMKAVFDIDITDIIDASIAKQNEELAADYEKLNK
jgi:hypothetical protein